MGTLLKRLKLSTIKRQYPSSLYMLCFKKISGDVFEIPLHLILPSKICYYFPGKFGDGD